MGRGPGWARGQGRPGARAGQVEMTIARLDRGSEYLSKKFVTLMHANGTQIIYTVAGAARALGKVNAEGRAVLATCSDQAGWCESLPGLAAIPVTFLCATRQALKCQA